MSASVRPLRSGLKHLSSSLRKLALNRTISAPVVTLSSACMVPGDDRTAQPLDRAVLIAQIRRLHRENENLLSELRRRNGNNHTPLCTSAHDLKTPLCTLESVVDALVHSLDNDRPSDEVRNLARLVELTSRRMRSLVDDILELGRVGDHRDEDELVDLGSLFARAVERHADTIARGNIEVRVAAPLPIVRGPRRDLIAVVANIVENAVKYAPTGRTHEICIGVDRSARPPLVWVRDTGCGFDPKKVDTAFTAYGRCNSEVDGTGLGLAIVKKAVEGWGGTVRIETRVDVGTTVYFTAPGGTGRIGDVPDSSWTTRQEDLR